MVQKVQFSKSLSKGNSLGTFFKKQMWVKKEEPEQSRRGLDKNRRDLRKSNVARNSRVRLQQA